MEENAIADVDMQAAPKKPHRNVKIGLIFGLVGLLILVLAVQEIRLLTSGEEVAGAIAEYQKSTSTNDDNFNTYDVTYEYIYKGVRYSGSFTKKFYNTSEINPGKRVGVTILPSNPGTSRLTSQLNPLFALLKLVGGLALLWLAVSNFRGKITD